MKTIDKVCRLINKHWYWSKEEVVMFYCLVCVSVMSLGISIGISLG
jgi:maltodextrin utilization protein YvdJ